MHFENYYRNHDHLGINTNYINKIKNVYKTALENKQTLCINGFNLNTFYV